MRERTRNHKTMDNKRHFLAFEKEIIDPTITEVIKNFPEYDNHPENWIESKEYWKHIFEEESNRDPELHRKFEDLHKKIVDMVVQFCEENKLENIDSVSIYADGIKDSCGQHEWTCFTDSTMSIRKYEYDPETDRMVKGKKNFLFEM